MEGKTVESRLYADSMTGATEKSKSTASKADEKELEKLHRQDFWLRIQRTKLLLDLLFVCTYFLPNILLVGPTRMTLYFFALLLSVRTLQHYADA